MKWSDRVKWGVIPNYMREGITRYVEQGIPPGHFLRAIFCDSLVESVLQADDQNVKRLGDYARFLVNQCPRECWGSPGDYRQWIGRGGIVGNDQHEPLPVHQWGRFADQDRPEFAEEAERQARLLRGRPEETDALGFIEAAFDWPDPVKR